MSVTDADPGSVAALVRARDRSAALPALWLLLVLAGLAYGLGAYPFFEPDEGRNAEVAREMVTTGDYLVPHLLGLPYLDKPVLLFAADALSFRLLGTSELAARLPLLLFTLATAALVGSFARRLFGPAASWIAATAALAMPLAVAFSRTVIFDAALTTFLTLALIAFYRAVEERAAGRRAAAWSALAWLAMGFGVLTKGPVALAVVLLIAVPYALWRRSGVAVWLPLGPVLFLAVVVPWVAVMASRVPGYLDYVLVSETWRRMTTSQFQRTGPVWYFLPSLLIGALPWSFVVLGAARPLIARDAAGRRDPRVVFLLLWIALPFVLFSLSQSKRPQYILPLLPAVALLATAALQRNRDRRDWQDPQASRHRPPVGMRTGAAAWIALGVLLVAAGTIGPARPGVPAELAAPLRHACLGWGALALAGGIAAWLAAGRREVAVVALAFPALALPLVLVPVLRDSSPLYSSRELARTVAPYLAPGDRVVGVWAYPASLPFYLGRSVLVAGTSGRELTSNAISDSYARWLAAPGTPLRPLAWWRGALAACSPPSLFVLHTRDLENRAVLEAAGVPLRFADGSYVAYGPCRPRGAAAGTR